MALDCLDTLVGLTDLECACFDQANRPAEYNTSSSGLYLTDPEYGFPAQQAILDNTPCEDGFWDVMADARTKAVQSTKTDLRLTLTRVRRKSFPSWEGVIGRLKWSLYNSVAFDTAGLQLRPAKRKHGFLKLNSISLGINETKSVDVTVRSNDPNFTAQTYTVSAVAGEFTRQTISGGLRLPMYRAGLNELYYYVEYELGGVKPMNNTLWCCGGRQWQGYVKAGGYGYNQAQYDRFDQYGRYTSNTANGLLLDAQFECDDLDWLCDLPNVNGYDMRDVLARTIQVKAAVTIIAYVLQSGRINRYSLLEADALRMKAANLQEIYEHNINWLAEELPQGITGCWGCLKSEPTVGSILV